MAYRQYSVARTGQEIDDQLNKAAEEMDKGSKWPGMSYEAGVEAGIRWLLGEEEHPPMED